MSREEGVLAGGHDNPARPLGGGTGRHHRQPPAAAVVDGDPRRFGRAAGQGALDDLPQPQVDAFGSRRQQANHASPPIVGDGKARGQGRLVRFVHDQDQLHLGKPRPFPEEVLEGDVVGLGCIDQNLDRAVIEVADPTVDSEPVGLPQDEGPVADALDLALRPGTS